VNRGTSILARGARAAAQSAGCIDFKDEGSDWLGVPLGTLTLPSSGEPVYTDGRWVTKPDALRLADAWGVELAES
jgi:hypothetical protein